MTLVEIREAKALKVVEMRAILAKAETESATLPKPNKPALTSSRAK